ncbi:MmcQ/YjbR family DNA-binding protein [Corallincola platygyrae]|uniref:MmcQ/YjbR family DNA-binding protein n=1 Tax=Corallincola platygyrae TaxID=1193278 RepID=A0ABW4XI40_9GAMM
MLKLDQPDWLRAFLLSLPDSEESYPFGADVAVFKVRNKMFALFGTESIELENGGSIARARLNIKCDPDEAAALRDIYKAVIPGYHMNKKHWNTVICDGSISKGEIERMIENSFRLVVATLPKKQQVGVLI